MANLVLWPDRYASQRRLVPSASMLACHGRVQREGEVVHVVADRLEDLSELLRSVGERDAVAGLAGSDLRRDPATGLDAGTGMKVRNPLPQPGPGIRVPTRDLRWRRHHFAARRGDQPVQAGGGRPACEG